MSKASDLELMMLDLVNFERTSRGLQPLEIHDELNDAAEDHSEWMLQTNTFSHTGEGDSSATQRIAESDYELTGSWRTAENIGWQSEHGDPGLEDEVRSIHENLMKSPGHRANILNPDNEHIGIGVEVGEFFSNGRNLEAVMITQNFARSDGEVYTPPAPAQTTDAVHNQLEQYVADLFDAFDVDLAALNIQFDFG